MQSKEEKKKVTTMHHNYKMEAINRDFYETIKRLSGDFQGIFERLFDDYLKRLLESKLLGYISPLFLFQKKNTYIPLIKKILCIV